MADDSNSQQGAADAIGFVPPLNDVEPQKIIYFYAMFARRSIHMRRAVHQVDLLSYDRVRWRSSLDFTIPNIPSMQETQEPLIVPLQTVPLNVLHDVDLKDEGGSSLPIVTRRFEYNLLVTTLLTLWAETHGGHLVSEAGMEEIKKLVWMQGRVARGAFERLKEIEAESEAMDSGGPEGGPALTLLWQSLQLFQEGGLLCASLRDWRPGERRILKLSYSAPETPAASRGPTGVTLARWLGRSVGVAPEVIRLPAPEFGSDFSVHYRVNAPENLAFSDGHFSHNNAVLQSPLARGSGVRPGAGYAHLYSSPSSSEDVSESFHADHVDIRLFMAPSRRGELARAKSTSIWMFFAILLTGFILPVIGTRGHTSEYGTLFLGFSVGLTAYLSNVVDNRITWRHLRFVRVLLMLTIVSALLTGIIVLGLPSSVGVDSYCPQNTDAIAYLIDCSRQLLADEDLGSFARFRWVAVSLGFAPVILFWLSGYVFWSRGLRRRFSVVAAAAGERLDGARGRLNRAVDALGERLPQREQLEREQDREDGRLN